MQLKAQARMLLSKTVLHDSAVLARTEMEAISKCLTLGSSLLPDWPQRIPLLSCTTCRELLLEQFVTLPRIGSGSDGSTRWKQDHSVPYLSIGSGESARIEMVEAICLVDDE